ACVRHWPGRRRGRTRIRTRRIDRWVCEVLALVALCRDDRDAVLLCVVDRPLLRLPDRMLNRIVPAVAEIRVGEIAAVRHVDVMLGSPHERADNSLRDAEPGR